MILTYMGLFSRKNKEHPEPAKQPECNHKYIDFGWYVKQMYLPSGRDGYCVQVCEPYVCVLCKHREDRVLNEWRFAYYKDQQKMVEHLLKDDRINDGLDIEDKIADMQMLDPYYLDAYYQLHPERKVDTGGNKKDE